MAPGRLFVVATPIGNLDDITIRAIRVLGEAAVIACEDTRHSRTLLERYNIRRPTVSLYRENEHQRTGELLRRLDQGEDVALISDAGTPLLSDPGGALVEAALEHGITVVPVPGPSAAIAALMAAGIGVAPVLFLGFLPPRQGERRRNIANWRSWQGTLVLFEAPHRLLATLADMEAEWGPERPLVVARELTKLHEEFVRGSITSVRARFGESLPRGEVTLVVGPPAAETPEAGALELQLERLTEMVGEAQKLALKRLARESGISRSELYRRLQQMRAQPGRQIGIK